MLTSRCILPLSIALWAAVAPSQKPLPGSVRDALEAALTRPWVERYDELFDACAAQLGDVTPLAAALQQRFDDDERGHAARWIASYVAWRDGRLTDAEQLVERVLAHRSDAMTRLRHARLLDSAGSTRAAEDAYRAVLVAEGRDEQTESLARLRLALLALRDDAETESKLLSEFARAEGRSVELRNRAANVLALIGRPQDACELYRVDGTGSQRFRDEVRLATWAVRAGQLERAQQHAWEARAAATLRRDRSYALSVLVEAHRADGTLDRLIRRFAEATELDDESRGVWIDLLRETGQIDEAVALFRSSRDEFTVDMQRELIEMYREAGRDAEMIATYRELIDADPANLAWREGLSRFHLEHGDVESARATWQAFLVDESLRPGLLGAATTAMELGLEEFATAACEICIREDRQRHAALLLLFQSFRRLGRLDEAQAALDRMDELAPEDSPDRAALSEAYEQLGQLDRAVEVLEELREARGAARIAEDLEIRLAWLYSQIGDDERAMQRYFELWRKVRSVARRRYVEDRLMTVASRLGKIAKLVVDLESKLAAGEADEQDSGLLVRLYTKVNDPVSAAEVIDEFFKQSGGDDVAAMQEKARVYLACTDYASYEDTVRALIELDAEGRLDYLRSLVMSQLERGRPDEAREVLAQLRALETGFDSAEFEAGVLALAGLRDDAIRAYRGGIAEHPNRIEIYLLLANLLKESGETGRAVQMFQFLAETADKDDLFTIAIDGLLNMEAPAPVLQWARRITLERMAGRHDKMYLYQLLSDLSEELGDRDGMFDALEGSLAIAGSRRPSILRELMDLAKGSGRGSRAVAGDSERQLAYGRRLISLSEIVPPQVYLDLGQAFLDADEISNAVKTFDLARDLADYAGFRRQVAELYERAGYLREALRTYKQVLMGSPSEIGLLIKVGELEEQVGRDGEAFELYRRAADLMIDRQPVITDKSSPRDDDGDSRRVLWRAQNVDDTARYLDQAITGMLVTAASEQAVVSELQRQVERLERALSEFSAADGAAAVTSIEQSPRLRHLSGVCRRLAFSVCRPDLVAAVDLRLVDALAADRDLLETLCKQRVSWGMTGAAQALVDAADRPEQQKQPLRFMFGAGGTPPTRAIPVAQVAGLLLPAVIAGDAERVVTLVEKADLTAATKDDLAHFPTLLAAARSVNSDSASLSVSQAWIRTLFKAKSRGYEIIRIHEQCSRGLSELARRRFDEFLVGRILRGLENTREFLRILPDLQKRYEDPLLTREQIAELIEKSDLQYAYGLGRLLEMLPAEDRASALRGRWGKVAKTKRLSFLLTVAGEISEPLGEDLAEFLVAAVPQALADHAEPFRYVDHAFSQMRENQANLDIAVRIADAVLEAKPDEWEPNFLRAVALAERGDEVEAARLAAPALMKLMNAEDYEWRSAVDDVAQQFFPTHVDVFLAEFDALESPTPKQLLRRLALVDKIDDPDRRIAEARAAATRYPDDVELGRRYLRALDAAGRRFDGLVLLQGLVKRIPKEDSLATQLARRLEQLRRPVEALAVWRRSEASSRGRDSRPGKAEVVPASKVPPPRIQRVKELLEAGDLAAARLEFRRLWRFGGGGMVLPAGAMISLSGSIRMGRSGRGWTQWPGQVDTEAAKARAERRRRGGMATFDDVVPDEVEPTSSYQVLAESAFGRAEMRRQLRSLPVEAIDSQRELIDGLLHAAVERQGEPAVFGELLQRVRDGRANRTHFVQLLELLDERAGGEQAEAARALLAELVRTVDPLDGGQVLRLAQVFGATGATESAALLYRWCALADQDRRAAREVQRVVRAAKQHLEQPQLIALVEEVLAWSQPDDDWSLESFETMALELWQEVAGPDVALARCRDLCARVLDVRHNLRRESAKAAAGLLARAGEIDEALRCLEVALCILPTDDVDLERTYYLREYETPGRLGHDDLRALFPVDASGWRGVSGWLERASGALEVWLDAGRLDTGSTVRALSLIACRLHAVGGIEAAGGVLDRLATREGVSPTDRLWVVDALRAVGHDERAHAIEKQLLDNRQLAIARAVEVVQRTADAEGLEAARTIGAAAAEMTQDDALLALLERLATEAGDDAAAAAWRTRIAESAAARAAIAARKQDVPQR